MGQLQCHKCCKQLEYTILHFATMTLINIKTRLAKVECVNRLKIGISTRVYLGNESSSSQGSTVLLCVKTVFMETFDKRRTLGHGAIVFAPCSWAIVVV